MEELYKKEKENKNKGSKDSPNIKKDLIEKIYIIPPNKLEKEEKIISNNNKNKEFSIPSFQGLNNKEIVSYLEKTEIPSKYFNKVLKEIFKYNNNKDNKNNNILIKFMEKYKNELSEMNIIYIFKKINEFSNIKIINDIIKFIGNNIIIDENYFLELLKEEKIELNKNIIESINNCLNSLNNPQNKINFVKLAKTLNLISLVKEIIKQEEYNKYEDELNKIYEEELNVRENKEKICEEEFNKDFNTEFINSMKIINSNSNKTYFIQETIKI
jgi:hypothetical protein